MGSETSDKLLLGQTKPYGSSNLLTISCEEEQIYFNQMPKDIMK